MNFVFYKTSWIQVFCLRLRQTPLSSDERYDLKRYAGDASLVIVNILHILGKNSFVSQIKTSYPLWQQREGGGV
jgi:hypothetical protein